MLKDYDIFNERERRLLYSKKPELRPTKVPNLNDANTIRVPSLSDVVFLEQPSVDQIIIEFLRQYEVYVKPRSVGPWNGWDTLSTASYIFAEEGSTLNIASTMFMANRSNQVNSAAQDWGTWKRWALDHKNFEKYRDDVIQTIKIHNETALKKLKRKLEKQNYIMKMLSRRLKNQLKKRNYIMQILLKNYKTQN